MSTLHQLLASDECAWRECLNLCQPGDSLLLADDAVAWLLDPGRLEVLSDRLGSGRLYALQADALARGLIIRGEARNLALLTDTEWVALVRSHERVLSWR
jgi:sulfur relay protein TusB/DsrH